MKNSYNRTNFNLFKFLFENREHKQIILKNTFWLSAAQGISGVINFFLMIYIIRIFGPTEYGKFAFAFAFVSLFSTLFDFGLSTTVTREFARDKDKVKHILDLLILKLIIGLGVLFVIFLGAFFITQDKLLAKIILILGFYIFAVEIINFFYAFFRSQQKMEIEAIFRIVQIAILSLMVLWIISARPSVLYLSYAYVGAASLVLLIIFGFSILKNNFTFLSLSLSFNKSIWKQFLIIGWYLALAKGVGDIIMNTDSVMLGYCGQVTEIGWYNAASKINGFVLFPMAMISSAIFPALIAILKESQERFMKYWEFWMKGTIFFSVLLIFIVLARADTIIEIAYSKDFLPSALVLKILVFMAASAYIHNIYFHTLLIFDRQRMIFYAMLISAALNVVLNLILIPRFSLYGAAAASVATHFTTLCLLSLLTSRYTLIKPFNRFSLFAISASVVSGLLMYFGVYLMDAVKINSFISISCGILIYLSLIVFFDKKGRNLNYLRV